jgi:hypothetical protein
MKELRPGTKEFSEYASRAAGMSPCEREAFRIASGVCIAADNALLERMSEEAYRAFTGDRAD